MNINKLIIISVIIASILYSKEDRVIISINGLESAGLSKRHINFAHYSIREISIDLEETVSKMIGDKYSINIHFTAYESVENTTNVARDSLSKIIKIIKDKYPDENLVTHHISHPYKGIQGVIIGKVQIQVNIDNSINLDKSVDISNKSSEIFDWIFMDLQDCRECISFNNVDMASINGKNTILLTRDDIYNDSWAVIIGIDKYKYSKQLNYAVKDAEAVKDMLISKFDFPEDNIKYLINEEATLSGIKLALDDISTSADKNDRILIFYSGHGETVPTQDDLEIGYIIPYEGRQNKPYATGLAMDEVLRICQLSKSKHMLFLMDACYSGLMTQQFKGLAKPTEEGYLTKVANESARQIITAGGRDEQVIERDEWQHSAFTKNLLEGLETWEADYNDDGCITADELSSYLREHVTEDSDFQQTPQDGRFKNSGGGEFVFFSDATITISSPNMDKEDKIIYGCMDKEAINYNPDATNPNRSCKYRKLINNLEFGQYKWEKTDTNRKIIEVPLLINNMKEVAGLQFDIIGGKVINILGGITEDKGFEINTNGNTIVAYATEKEKYTSQPTNVSAGGGILSGGNQVLFILQIEPNNTEICIQDIIVADLNGNALNSISLDCIRPKIP